MLNRVVRAVAGVTCGAALLVALTGCSVVSRLTGDKPAAASASPQTIAEIYKARLATLGSTDIAQLSFYNGNVSVTGWVGNDLKTATQMGTLIPTTVDTSFGGGSLPADRFDVTAMNQRLATSTACKKDPMLMVSVAPSGAILESLSCAGNLLDAQAWLDGKPLTAATSVLAQETVTTVLTTAALTLGDKIDMIQIGAADSYARANVKTRHGTFTVVNGFASGGRPTLTLMTPTLADGPQLPLQTVTPAAVWTATQTALATHHVGVDQIQLITVMVVANEPMVSVVLRGGSREDVRLA
jgi:hypothetical protein